MNAWKITTASVVVVLAGAIVLVGWERGVFFDRDDGGSQAAKGTTGLGSAVEGPALFDKPIDGDRVSLSEAQRRVPWAIPLPSYTVTTATLAEAWVSFFYIPPERRQVYLKYSNGLDISIWPEAQPLVSLAAPAPPFRSVTVRGTFGKGKDAGEQQIPGHGVHKYPASVSWQEKGLAMNIYSYDFPMAELVKVAESMPE